MTKRLVQRHLMLTRALISLVHQLEHKQIDYRILKGIPLNQLLYGHQLVRHSCDIDVLINIDDLEKLDTELSHQGYVLQCSRSLFNLICQKSFLSHYMDQLAWQHPETKVTIDVQWHASILNDKGFTLKNYTASNEILINQQAVKTLTPEQNFHYLCVHAAKHLWERPQWLNDLAAFHQNVDFCWHQVIALANTSDSLRSILEAKYLLRKYHQVELQPVPHTVMDHLLVKFRLLFIRQTKHHMYTNIFLTLLVYPRLDQKKHYLIRTLLLRIKSLRQTETLNNPTPFKMILRSLV